MILRIKNTLIVTVILISIATPATLFAQSKEITLNKIPSSPEEFVQMRNELAKTPEGGAAMLIAALAAFSKSRELGMACLTIALDKSNISQGNAYKGYKPANSFNYHLRRMDGKKWWPFLGFAYMKGATPDNGYKVPAPYTIVTSRNKYSGDESKGRVKVFIKVFGFRARPAIMKRNKKGHWKALGISSFFLDVYKPKNKAEAMDEL